MNDLVFVMYKFKLKHIQTRKFIILPFDDIKSNDEWIIKNRDNIEV